jgi:uncharacterized protein YndB with AHSA1/START domain
MPLHDGYLLIADISGYTAYLTSSELEHANPILRSLLEALITEIGDPLHLWRMEGDAVLAYSLDGGFPSGHAFLTICENLYNAFASRQLDIRANTTCPCKACSNVASLDLKILAHHGQFEEMKIGPMVDVSGPAAILVHLMAKTDVKERTGIHSYAMFSQPAIDVMQLSDVPMAPYKTSFDHFGEVEMQVYDLAEAWTRYRGHSERTYLSDEDAVFTYTHHVRGSLRMVWEHLMAPELKREWMGMRRVKLETEGPRLGLGTRFHCIHEAMEFKYWLTDWRPFQYFSTQISDSIHIGLSNAETYELREVEDGVDIIYRMGPLTDADGNRHVEEETEIAEFLAGFWPQGFAVMEKMLIEAAKANPGPESMPG